MAKKYNQPNTRDPDLDIFSMIILVKGPNAELGGFIPRFFSAQNITERCMCCHGIPRSPFIAPCGHNVCHSCLHNHVLISHNPSCLTCDSPIQKEKCYPDIPLSGRLNMSDISCPYVSSCRWSGRVEDLKNHFNICDGVNRLFRSWMESIQVCVSDIQGRSRDLESRVDNLERGINKHREICQQRYIEQDGRSKHFTQQLVRLREQSQVQPKDAERDEVLRSRALLEVLTALALDVQDDEKDPEPPANVPPPNVPPPQQQLNAPQQQLYAPQQIFPPQPPQPDIAGGNPGNWTCAYCSLHNPQISKICQACSKTRTPVEIDAMRNCNNCQTPTNPIAEYCHQCGYHV